MSCSKTVVSYAKLVSELEQMVKRMVFESYGADKYYDFIHESSTYLLRLMKYRCPEMNEKNLGCEVHTDKSFITVLHQNKVNGLEIRTKDGYWIGFDDPTPSYFIVLAGDAFLVGRHFFIYIYDLFLKEEDHTYVLTYCSIVSHFYH